MQLILFDLNLFKK